MKGHKVVTVERNGGYAARCEYERDGITHLCDATFGGFASRTEARAAIVHEEAPGAAVTAAEGQTTPQEGIMQNNTHTVSQDTDLREQFAKINARINGTREIREAVAEIAAQTSPARRTSEDWTKLPEGSPLTIDLDAFRELPYEKFGDRAEVINAYRLDNGDPIFVGKQPVGWIEQQLSHLNDLDRRMWLHSFPNTWIANDEFLFVSGGSWYAVGTGPGYVEYRSVMRKMEEDARVEQQEQDAWLAEHADEVAAVRPSWAETINCNSETVWFGRQVGAVHIDVAYYTDTWKLIGPAGLTLDYDGEDLTASKALFLAADLAEAAMILDGDPVEDVAEQTTVIELYKVAVFLGVNPSDLLALRNTK